MKAKASLGLLVAGLIAWPAASLAQAEEQSVLSTAQVARIFGTPTFDGSDFFDAKSQALYCYYEERKAQTADFIVQQVAAGADRLTKTPIEMASSPCIDRFHAVARQDRFKSEPEIFPTTWTYDEVRLGLIRYIASCIWERDTASVRASIATLEDYRDIGAHLMSGYVDGQYAGAGSACFPGFAEFEAGDLTFRYNLLQQLLLRREID